MPPPETKISVTTYVMLVIILAVLTCFGAIFSGAGSSFIQRLLNITPEATTISEGSDGQESGGQDSVSALETQIALQETVIAQQEDLLEETDIPPKVTPQPTATSSQPLSTTQESSNEQFSGWVICWHGRDGYEYLIAYPESDANQGISLNFNLINAQGSQVEVANDSLKMCYIDSEWYGYSDPNPWFPTVSYMKLLDREILVCSDSPGCKGSQWTMLSEKYFPWNAPELQAPKETGIHIITYKSSQ